MPIDDENDILAALKRKPNEKPVDWEELEKKIEASTEFYQNHSDNEEWSESGWAAFAEQQEQDAQLFSGRDYAPYFRDMAVYAPALSPNYVKQAGDLKSKITSTKFAQSDLNFLNPKTELFFYPYCLYSAGQAAKTQGMANQTSWISSQNRAENTYVIADSGGFQIQEGKAFKFEGDSTCERMLRWMENTADYSMILDFPTGGIDNGTVGQHIDRLEAEGLDVTGQARKHKFNREYMACLLQTEFNNQYFQKHRKPDATKLLNVIQGRNEKESRFWYERMKSFEFEGIAFAGKHSTEFALALARIFQMLDDGLLKNCPWIHFLGISTLRTSIALTFLQRELRAHPDCNSEIQISYDSSNPSRNLQFGYNTYAGADFSSDRWSFKQISLGDQKYAGDKRTLNEICEQDIQQSDANLIKPIRSTIGHFFKPGQMMTPNKQGRMGPNKEAQELIVNHNIECMVRVFRELGRFTQPVARGVPLSISKLDSLMVYLFEFHKQKRKTVSATQRQSHMLKKVKLFAAVLDELAIGGN